MRSPRGHDMAGPSVHSDEIKRYVRPRYSLSDLDLLEAFLVERGVLSFRRRATGLYPAAQLDAPTSRSGYHNVWVRDNVFVAHAHHVNGRVDAAVGVVKGLCAFFSKYLFVCLDCDHQPWGEYSLLEETLHQSTLKLAQKYRQQHEYG